MLLDYTKLRPHFVKITITVLLLVLKMTDIKKIGTFFYDVVNNRILYLF